MTHDCFVCIWEIFGGIGVCEAFEGVTVASFDGIKPGLLDWEAKTGMIESNKDPNAGKIKALWIKGSTCSPGCKGNSLGSTADVVD
jgi:hypothetical protein